MTNGYAKVFSTILASSIWQRDDRTRLVWITMLVMMDAEGIVRGSVSGLANFARVPLPDVKKALDEFLSPDEETQTQENEGRRVERIEGGWKILNHAKYQAMMSLEERQAYWRRKKAESRLRLKEISPSYGSSPALKGERAAVYAMEHGHQDAADQITNDALPTQKL